MEALVYFLLWAGLIFLMMRFGCGAHLMGHAASQHPKQRGKTTGDAADLRWVPPKTDVDPVCGKTVDTGSARSSVHDGYVYYFCSRDCREVFEAAPHLHIDRKPAPEQPKLEHDHA